MWQLRPHLGDPRLHFLGLLVALMLVVAGWLAHNDPAPCPACPGHQESASNCLCYHAPTTPESFRR